MKKLYYFFVKSGEILFIWSLLLIISITIYSLTIRGKVNYGNRCYANIDDTFIKEYKYEKIELENSNLECNTYYLMYTSLLDEANNLKFLLSLSKLLIDNNINLNMHVIIKGDNYQMLSTIVDYKVSYVISQI